jgi:nucleoside-diphosphate-sugar epimerase
MAPPLPSEDLTLILAKTRDLWHEMREQQIFITGGTGFFGCWLVESFAYINRMERLGAHATILTRDQAEFARNCPHLAADPAITLLAGDVRSFTFPDGQFKYVIHAATESGAKQVASSAKQIAESPLEMLATILQGTERTLKFAASHGTRKFLFTSSGAVYGRQRVSHVAEDDRGGPDPVDPSSAYAEGKRAAELMCSLYAQHTEVECKIARCFAFVGPHLPLDAHFAIGNFIRDTMRGGPIEIRGDGSPKRSYLYAADLAIWLWTLLFQGPSMQAFNVGSEDAISIRDLAQAVVAELDPRVKVNVAKDPTEGAEVQQYVPSTLRAREQLGLAQHVELSDAIRRTAAWYRSKVDRAPK